MGECKMGQGHLKVQKGKNNTGAKITLYTLHSHETFNFFLMSGNNRWRNAQIKQENMILKGTILNMASAQHYFLYSQVEPMSLYLLNTGTHNGTFDSFSDVNNILWLYVQVYEVLYSKLTKKSLSCTSNQTVSRFMQFKIHYQLSNSVYTW